MKIEQESQQLVREIGVDSLSDPKVKRLNQNLIDHLAQILGEKLRTNRTRYGVPFGSGEHLFEVPELYYCTRKSAGRAAEEV
jgi:hypothetical protein